MKLQIRATLWIFKNKVNKMSSLTNMNTLYLFIYLTVIGAERPFARIGARVDLLDVAHDPAVGPAHQPRLRPGHVVPAV